MRLIATILGVCLAVLMVGGYSLIYLKGLVVSVVVESPSNAQFFHAELSAGEDLAFLLLPDQKAALFYSAEKPNCLSGALVQLRQRVATHIAGRLWNLDGPGELAGLRWYPRNATPYVAEFETLKSFHDGPCDRFRKPGDKRDVVLVRVDDRLLFQDVWLKKTEVDEEDIAALVRQFD